MTELIAYRDAGGALRFYCGPHGRFDDIVDPHERAAVVWTLRFDGALTDYWRPASGASEDGPQGPSVRRHLDDVAAAAGLEEMAGRLGLEAEDLDEHVIELACAEASDINNGGLSAQIAYLMRSLGAEETRLLVESARTESEREPA